MPKKRTQNDEIQELKGMVFDIKDNHLKSIYEKVGRLDERTKIILGLVSAILLALIALFFGVAP